MSDTTSRSSVVPADPKYKFDHNTEERSGVVWHWDRQGMWWPTKDLLDYGLLARDRKQPAVYNHALLVRAAEIEWLENRSAGSLAPKSKLLLREHEVMNMNVRNIRAAARSSRNGWIAALVIVLLPVLAMGGCAAKQAADDAQATADRQDNGAWRCQELIRSIADPDKVTFSPTESYGTDGITVEGDMVRSSDGVSARGSYECSDQPVATGGWMMHVDRMVGN